MRAEPCPLFIHTAGLARHYLTLCEATARSTKLRKIIVQFYKSVFYQKKEALLFITTLPCLKVFASLHGQQCNVTYRKPGQDLPGSNPVVSHFFTLIILYREAQNYSSCFLFSKTNGV